MSDPRLMTFSSFNIHRRQELMKLDVNHHCHHINFDLEAQFALQKRQHLDQICEIAGNDGSCFDRSIRYNFIVLGSIFTNEFKNGFR